MSVEESVQVRVTHRFTASAERVFDAWLDARTVGQWLFATPTGQVVVTEIDPRVGGRYRIVDRRDGQDVEHFGEYLEIDRPRRLVFTLSVTGYEEVADRITIDVVPLESGCELTLTHEMHPEFAEWADRTESGWTTILAKLAEVLG